ncbi:carbohydrate binding family 9 domain-containing protein [Maribellus sediminis]|uniref:carbohydrate binding family 9 domain-containing protein n=1 Tax=Maribellus sediminis TaxID=2696285 RepID=UPI00143162DA|nr:carbohydrate binding family 9 domain-containing protein [Maribellus sediminis]
MNKILVTVVLFLTYGCLNILWAQNTEISATRVSQSPVLDGNLSDNVWNQAVPFSGLKMVEPYPGNEPTENTEIRVIYDDNNLYLGIRCFDNEPGKIASNTMEHDQGEDRTDDKISILLDPFQDKRSAYIFIVNPRGARSEGFAAGEHYSLGWDGIWDAKSKISSQGWTTEIKIPFKTISFNKNLNAWGLNVERYIARKQEVIRYSGISLNSFFSNPVEAGLLSGIDSVKQGLGLTIRPYGITGFDVDKTTSEPADKVLDGGFDIYKNITPNLVAAVTYNTDFAETEVDERKLNLTRFPLFFPEKRTFFLEGSDIFDFGAGAMGSFHPFFSRRIGLFEGSPVPITFGSKVYGKIKNTNLALLDVQTGATDDLNTQNLFAGRISQNILKESKFGIIGTYGEPTGERNALLGVDFAYKTSRFLGANNLIISMWGIQNWNEKKSGNKNAAGIKFDYPNDLWDIALNYIYMGDSIQPGLGFMPRNSYHYLYTGFSYMPRLEKGWIGDLIRQWFLEFRVTNYWNLEGNLESRSIFTAPVNFRTESGEHIEFNVISNREVLPMDFEVSDGIIIPQGDYSFVNYRAEVNTASFRKLQFDVSYRFGEFYSGHYNDLETEVTLKFNGYVNLQVGGNFVNGKLPQGDFSEAIYSTRLQLYLTPDLGLSNYVQYDNVSNMMGYNGRLFWQVRPGNIIYLVYNTNMERRWTPNPRFYTTENQLRFKVQLSIRI